jgi:hypothetical protein
MKPGSRLRALARRVCSERTMEWLIDPLIADLQSEHDEVSRRGRPWADRLALVMGYLAFWKAVSCYIPVRIARTASTWPTRGAGTVRGGLAAATVTMIVATTLLVAGPLRNVQHGGHVAWLLVLLFPQSLPVSLPLVLFVAVVHGSRRRALTRRVLGAVLVVGLTATLGSFSTINWLVPTVNQAVRVTVGGRRGPRGPGEVSPRALRTEALAMKNDGLAHQAGSLLLGYHLQWAVAGTPLVLALFGLAMTVVPGGRGATALVGSLPFCYIIYMFQLGSVSRSVFSNESVAIAAAWLPNMILMLASAAIITLADEARARDGFEVRSDS